MAEITNHPTHKNGTRRSKKLSTRIDMTPMVDLGFLLITFFVLVTSFSQSRAMDLKIPAKEPPINNMEVKESKVLQLVLADHNKVYWYRGMGKENIDSIDFSNTDGLRNIIKIRKNEVRQKWGSDSVMIVLIKPMKQSNYKNLVDALDEMAINGVKTYMLAEFKMPEDSSILCKRFEK
jgi:biopolymer transport protein ExbD